MTKIKDLSIIILTVLISFLIMPQAVFAGADSVGFSKTYNEWATLSNSELCYAYHVEEKIGAYDQVVKKSLKCENTIKQFKVTPQKISKRSDYELCDTILFANGDIRDFHPHILTEINKRNITPKKCRFMTKKFTGNEKQEYLKQEALIQKKQRIDSMKADCRDLGFTDGTEGMGNCVLKLMELAKPNQVVISNPSSGSNTISTDAQRLKIEQERLAMEKFKARQDAANKLMDMGKCWSVMGDYSPYC
tara:strand:+ start:3244 stop:3987 length:744 start_codon:yes stop_codon:yes gene_type:complete